MDHAQPIPLEHHAGGWPPQPDRPMPEDDPSPDTFPDPMPDPAPVPEQDPQPGEVIPPILS